MTIPFDAARLINRFIEVASESHRRAACLLVLVCLVSFLPGLQKIPPIDRDEPRYAQASKQMLDTGDYIDIRIQEDQFNDKPIGIYWLQAAAVKAGEVFGVPDSRDSIWLYRIPSVLGAILGVLGTYWCALAFLSRRGALIAALMMAGSILLNIEARLATTDAMLMFSVVFAMGALARVYLAVRGFKCPRSRFVLVSVFWTAIAAGVLIKGLVILMVVGLTAAALCILDRGWRWTLVLRPFSGAAWTALLVLPWLIAISLRTEGEFLRDAVGHETLGKLVESQQGHGQLPGYYFVLFFLTFFPASVLTGMAFRGVISRRNDPTIRFLLAWIIPSWIVFELAVTKLPHYVLPLYPAIAILFATAIEKHLLSNWSFLVRNAVWWLANPIIFSILLISITFAIGSYMPLPAWPILAAAIVLGFFTWRLYRANEAAASLVCAVASSALFAIAACGFVIPALSSLFPSNALAQSLDGRCANPTAIAVGYNEPSLVFLVGSTIRFSSDPSAAADFLIGGSCRFAFISSSQESAFLLRANTIHLRLDRRATVEGFNVGRPERVSIVVYQSKEGPAD